VSIFAVGQTYELRMLVTQRFAITLVMKLAYGHRILSDDDEYIKLAENASIALSSSGAPGMTPPDLLPICVFAAALVLVGS
jgi:hypothetical protein